MTARPDRCEPPEELRGVDGRHWLNGGADDFPANWDAHFKGWSAPDRHRQRADVAAAMGYRYIGPVTPPATVTALADALAECAAELEAEIAHRYGDVAAYPSLTTRKENDMDTVTRARAALALYRWQA